MKITTYSDGIFEVLMAMKIQVVVFWVVTCTDTGFLDGITTQKTMT
jgi:hypothetical protein